MKVAKTFSHSGKINLFKIKLRCQHNTRCKIKDIKNDKNMQCPAIITMHNCENKKHIPHLRLSYIYLTCVSVTHAICREIIKESLLAIGIDPKPFSTHSLRAEGATFMAKTQAGNPRINGLLKLQGRWKSESSKDMYIQR